ncbi:MAG: hypothetical protein P8Q36_02405, partial [Alphaproteobacteria bacterium]|nr:hypothetical protein [Alphaproteobacteria bacterium]
VAMKMVQGLLHQERLDRLVLTNIRTDRLRDHADMLASAHGIPIDLIELDGCNHRDVTRVLRDANPDLVLQAASLFGPWAVIGSDHPVIRHLSASGIGIQLPNQLPVLTTVMRAIRDLGLTCPVANISAPDVTHPVLATQDLAPTVGLGNVSMHLLRARAAWRARQEASGDAISDAPLLRLIGHHCHVYGVMQASYPDNPDESTRVFLGENGERDDLLAYEGRPFPAGSIYNVITAISTLPVLSALLPDGPATRYSTPAPFGLPGGYPLHIEAGRIAFDLPPRVSEADAVAFNRAMGKIDGIEAIDADGTTHFTAAACAHAARVDPRLAEPINPNDLEERTRLLLEVVQSAS